MLFRSSENFGRARFVDFFGANEAEGAGVADGELRAIGRGSRRAVITNSPPSRCIETHVFAQPAPRAVGAALRTSVHKMRKIRV